MGRERIEVQVQAIAGRRAECRKAAKRSRREWMTRCAMCWVRGPSSSTGRIFVRGSIASHRKTDLFSAAEPCSQFVQLEVWEVEMAEGSFVQRLSVHGLHE